MKNAAKLFWALCAVILAACFITGCPDPAADPDNPQVEPVQPRSVRYISTDSENNRYTLVITEKKSRSSRAAYTPQSGDTFVLTVEMYNNGNYTVSITSSGNVRNSSGVKLDLQLSANDSSLTLTVTIGNDEMTGINGTIVSDDGKTEMPIEATMLLRPAIVKTELKAALDAAAAAKAGVIASANGSDVLTTAYWVTTEQMNVFNSVISTAQAVYDNGEAKQAALDTAEAVLLTATKTFNGQKKAGSKTGAAPTLTGIAISAPPTKTEYEIGDTLDLASLVVTAVYSDDTTAVIGISELTTGGFDSSTPGSKTVTITYNGKSAFSGCSSLTSVRFEGTITAGNFSSSGSFPRRLARQVPCRRRRHRDVYEAERVKHNNNPIYNNHLLFFPLREK